MTKKTKLFEPSVNGSNRIQVLDFPQAAPAHCAICFNPGNDERKFIDFDFSLEFYGAVIFCSDCIQTVMNGLGWISPIQWKEVQESLTEALEFFQKASAENVKLRAALDTLSFIPSISNDSSSDSEISSEPITVEGPDNPGPPKSTSKRGSANISDPEPDEPFIKFTE